MSHDTNPALAVVATDDEWKNDFSDFVRGRLVRVQAAAQTWLSALTLLLGLYSTAVVVNGGSAVADLPGGTAMRMLVLLLALVVFGLAMAAVIFGAMATWGGLGLRPETEHRTVADRWDNAWNGVDLPDTATWRDYRSKMVTQSDERRRYLHHSRLLGIVAGMFAGLLAVLVLASRTWFPAPAAGQHPTDLVVVRDGQVSCGQASTDTAGQVRVAGRSLSAVTQLLQVDHC